MKGDGEEVSLFGGLGSGGWGCGCGWDKWRGFFFELKEKVKN